MLGGLIDLIAFVVISGGDPSGGLIFVVIGTAIIMSAISILIRKVPRGVQVARSETVLYRSFIQVIREDPPAYP